MKDVTCCFTGNRDIPEQAYPHITHRLRQEIEKLILLGYRYFATGGARGFDLLASQTVLGLREAYADIRLILVLPCTTQTKGWQNQDITIYNDVLSRCDKAVYTSEHYFRGCMHKRNRHLVDSSSVCIAYSCKEAGGTVYTMQYAIEKGLRIIRIDG